MNKSEEKLQSIYLNMIGEAIRRINSARSLYNAYINDSDITLIESAILQVRKALEATAYAAVAPNKNAYEKFRASASESTNFTKDYHAGKIFRNLSKINENFYPLALLPAVKNENGVFHFERKTTGYLTKNRFETIYDRLGKHLHAHNPWSNNKNLQNVVRDIPQVIEELFGLLELHAAFIQTPVFNGVWVIEIGKLDSIPKISTGIANGEFRVQYS